jgi:hypothetical protein
MATYFVYSSHSISLTYHNDRSSRTHITALSIFRIEVLANPYMVKTSQALELYITPRHVESGVVCDLQFPDGHPVGGTFVWFPTPFLL